MQRIDRRTIKFNLTRRGFRIPTKLAQRIQKDITFKVGDVTGSAYRLALQKTYQTQTRAHRQEDMERWAREELPGGDDV